jgi:hypothetical protein
MEVVSAERYRLERNAVECKAVDGTAKPGKNGTAIYRMAA